MIFLSSFFFFNDTATTEIYTLSLHDALPIWLRGALACRGRSPSPELERRRPCAAPGPRAQPARARGRNRARARGEGPVPRSPAYERGGAAPLYRLRLQAGRRSARLLSGASRPRGRAGSRARSVTRSVNARSERYLEEMGLAPVWKLRGPKRALGPGIRDQEKKSGESRSR